MKYDYDILVIGLGPAGMAVAAMGSEMGLKVCGIEKKEIGGECMNCGCIPSKALITIANSRHNSKLLKDLSLEKLKEPEVKNIFKKIEKDLDYIGEQKTKKMFHKVKVIYDSAEFVNKHTIKTSKKKITAKFIFIATGTKPSVPPIPGLKDVKYETNETIFKLKKVPKSLFIIGGGAIGTELAQSFNRLGCKCTIAHIDERLLAHGDPEIGDLLDKKFEKEGIELLHKANIKNISETKAGIVVDVNGRKIKAEKILVAAGRKFDFNSLKLQNTKVKTTRRGIVVDKHLRTANKNIFAVGDCNGFFLLSHAAMHQGMIGLMNAISPIKMNFKKFVVPWTVFSDPEVSSVGKFPKDAIITKVKYEDYGAAIAENIPEGFVKVATNKKGRVLGATVVGENSGEMINEWGLAIQKKLNIKDIMFLQHSFPSMSFLNKRVAEEWMMAKIPKMRKIIKFFFKLK